MAFFVLAWHQDQCASRPTTYFNKIYILIHDSRVLQSLNIAVLLIVCVQYESKTKLTSNHIKRLSVSDIISLGKLLVWHCRRGLLCSLYRARNREGRVRKVRWMGKGVGGLTSPLSISPIFSLTFSRFLSPSPIIPATQAVRYVILYWRRATFQNLRSVS